MRVCPLHERVMQPSTEDESNGPVLCTDPYPWRSTSDDLNEREKRRETPKKTPATAAKPPSCCGPPPMICGTAATICPRFVLTQPANHLDHQSNMLLEAVPEHVDTDSLSSVLCRPVRLGSTSCGECRRSVAVLIGVVCRSTLERCALA